MSQSVVDLRSDTVTRPTPAMREAIARAEVDDDTLGHDPTVFTLERKVAELLGKEAALFFPTGTMANQAALALLTRPGTETIVEATSHLFDLELGAPAVLSGIQLRAVTAPGGLLTAELVDDAIRPRALLRIETSAICLENTHNAGGGRILPLETMQRIGALARRHELAVHLDGSRLWNAAIATGVAESAWAAEADTVMVTLSKGLGCPIGSLLAGDGAAMLEARRIRRRLGGSMRQVGILAAAGIYAIDHNRARLGEDHVRAARLARLLADLPGITITPPETNIVMIEIQRSDLDAAAALARLAEHGVLLTEFGRRKIRAVTHLDVGDAAIDRAATAIARVFG